jgi:acyl carrier protein
MSVDEKVKEVLLQVLDVEENQVVPTAHLRKDLDASSVDLVEIMAALENEYDMEISEEEAAELLTVRAIVGYIQERTA